ncbi:MAG: hypothetical protein HEEMFOPI_01186 [Holosporales bacterium]
MDNKQICLFIKNMQRGRLNVVALSLTIVFVILLQNSHVLHADHITLSILMVLPPVIFIQEISNSVTHDMQLGVLEMWIGNNKTSISYIILKSFAFILLYIVPFLAMASFFVFQISHGVTSFLYVIVCLFLMSLSLTLLSCVLSFSKIPSYVFSILLITITLPLMLITLQGFYEDAYIFSILMCFGFLFINSAFVFIFPPMIQKSVF